MITIEAINQINQQYLQRMNEIEAMKVQTIMRSPIHRPMNREYFSTRLADIMDGNDNCQRCAGDGTIDYVCPWCGGNGCKVCHNNGMIVEPCPECQEVQE